MSEHCVNLSESNLLNENRTQHAKEPLVNTADQKKQIRHSTVGEEL